MVLIDASEPFELGKGISFSLKVVPVLEDTPWVFACKFHVLLDAFPTSDLDALVPNHLIHLVNFLLQLVKVCKNC
jgi:hypothetical protein